MFAANFIFYFFSMRQTLRQIVAVLALAGLAMSLVPNALAATYTDLSAANKLATAGVIVDKSATPADYRLGDTLLRQEGVGVAGKALGILNEANEDYTCMNKFSDISEAWVCRAAELAAKAGLTNASNSTFRPKDNLTKYEAMLFALRSSCMVPEDKSVSGVAAYAADAGIITTAASFNGTAAATRGEFFRYVATAMEDSACGDTEDEDVLCTLFPDLCVDEDTDTETPANGDVEVSLSDDTPNGRTLPKGANGVWVASYVIEASDDTTISGVTLSREGLSEDLDTTGFAILVDGVRMTDSKDENSDDEVTLTLNGGLNIDAGDSVTLDVVIDTATGASTGAEIAVALTEVMTAGDVDGLPVVGETFKIGSIDAPSLEILTDGSVSDPKLGEVEADLFRFKVENTSDNDTVSLEAITFEQTGGIDETSELGNFVLLKGSEVLATVESTDSKYVTFMLDEPLEITEGNTVSLKVAADILGGAAEDVEFGIDQKLDVVASTERYGTGVAVTGAPVTFTAVDVDAGAISLVKMDATSTKIREDKDDVVLGTLDIVAGQAGLEVKEIGFTVTATADDVGDLIENVQLRNVKTGARYDLNDDGNLASTVESFDDTSFDVSLAVGSNKFEFIVDTKNTIADFDTKTLTLSMDASTQLVVEETSDDEEVTDVTPSSLTWKKVDGSESAASVSVVPLSDLTRVRGAANVSAIQIEIKADESSALTLDELKAFIRKDVGGTPGAATNQMVSEVSLFEGTDTSGTPLDAVSGSRLSSGVATFDGFEVMIPANGKKTFTITVSFVDSTTASDAANSPYQVEVLGSNISLEDDENDDVVVGGTYTSARDITITDVGSITLTADANNTENKEVKSVLGGNTTAVFSVDVQATNESVDVESVVFTYTAATSNLLAAGARAELWLGDTKIATAPNSDITSTTITFGGTNAGDLTNLIIPQETKELKLAIISETIGYENAGLVVKGVDITDVDTVDATGVSSGRDVADATVDVQTSSALFSVIPTILTPSVVATLGTSSASAKVKLTANSGGNTVNASSSTPTVSVDSLTFSAPGASGIVAADYVLYEEGKSGTTVTGKASGSNIVFDFADANIAVTATRTVTVGAVPADNETVIIGSCTVTFDAVAGATTDDTNCTGGATIDLDTGAGDVARTAAQLSAVLDTLTNVTDPVQGALTLSAGGAATTLFTAGSAITGSIVFTDGTSGDVTATNTAGSAAVTFANGSFTTEKTYVIVPTMGSGDTASLTLLKTGVQYDVDVTNATNLTTTLPNELEFGTRSID
jgi:S-layer homology domain